MNDVFFIPTAISTAVSYLGFIAFVAAFWFSWGFLAECLFLGIAICGLIFGLHGVSASNQG